MRISTTRWVWPELSPFFHNALRERLKYQASPEAIVFAKASAFICATISTSPDTASVATQVTSPLASNFGVSATPSSRSASVPGGANGDWSANEYPPHRRHAASAQRAVAP